MLPKLTGQEIEIKRAEKIREDIIARIELLEMADKEEYHRINSWLSPKAGLSLEQTNIAVTPEVMAEIKNFMIKTKTEAEWYRIKGANITLPGSMYLLLKELYIGKDGLARQKVKRVEIIK